MAVSDERGSWTRIVTNLIRRISDNQVCMASSFIPDREERIATKRKRAGSFALGLSMGFLPAFAPFAALAYSIAGKRSFSLNDALWLFGAVLFAIPSAVHDGFSGFAFSLVTVGAPWFLYRAFSQLPRPALNASNALGAGLVTSLGLVVLLGFLQIDQLNFAYRSALQAIVWEAHPSLYGHSILVLGIASALFNSRFRLKLLSLAISAIGIVISGSREAAIAWVVIAVIMPFTDKVFRSSQRIWALLATVVMLVIVSLLGVVSGWGRAGFLIDLVPGSSGNHNLIQSSEIPQSSWWFKTGVEATSEAVVLQEAELTSYRITKITSPGWSRLQQVVSLNSGETYTVSTWVQLPDGPERPGIQGWGEIARDSTMTIVSNLRQGELQVSVSGPAELLDYGIADRSDNWIRIYFTFKYTGRADPLHWYVGLTPDNRPVTGSTSTFAGFDIKAGAELTPYTPGVSSSSVGLDVARIPYWRAAWNGFVSSPLIGVSTNFADYFEFNWPARERFHATPAHAHNLFLHVMFERGLVGLLGLILVLAAILEPAIRRMDVVLVTAIGAVLVANLFDNTFFHGAVLYPLVAIAGWRNSRERISDAGTEDSSRTLIARLTLAAGDYLSVLLALAISTALDWLIGGRQAIVLSPVLLYSLLLWPALALREGLYPGYGLARQTELQKHVSGIATAWLIFSAGALLFPDSLRLSGTTLFCVLPLTLILAPVIRSLTKQVLLYFESWGRPVVVLGTGEPAQRIVESLVNNPSTGYMPQAIFTKDEREIGRELYDIPIAGNLSTVTGYCLREGIDHAIVVLDSADTQLANRLSDGSLAVLRNIQYVPHLSYLPTFGVSASNLDNILTLQVNNELLSPSRQAFKRTIDIIGAGVGGLLILPLLLLIALAIKLDSRGPVLFGHKRVGKDGKHFKAWKFRSMVPDAETRLADYLQRHPELRSEWQRTQKLQDDPRITRVGRFLRKYSLDELPQLWNVLVGEMSLVGPRPIVDAETDKYGDALGLYTAVRSGMTGYWQVSGRSDTDYAYRVELDSFYVRNWSVWLDIIIILRTFKVVIKGDGAY